MRSVTFQKTEIIPNKIVCVGKNYAAHIEEMGSVPSDQMTVFMKPNACISDQLVNTFTSGYVLTKSITPDV